MKKILITLSAIITMGLCATAQTPDEVEIVTDDNVQLEIITPAEPVKESKKEKKEREKWMRQVQDEAAFAKASNSLRRGYFVLVADYIEHGRSGYRHFNINPNSNFILAQADDGIIQFALNTGNPGINGLGGWTGKGQVRNKRIVYNDNGDVFMQYHMVGSSANVDVDITLFHGSKYALAHVSGTVNFTIYGELLPYRDKEHK